MAEATSTQAKLKAVGFACVDVNSIRHCLALLNCLQLPPRCELWGKFFR